MCGTASVVRCLNVKVPPWYRSGATRTVDGMGRIVLMMSVSLDGFIEGPDHDLSWSRVSDEYLHHVNGVIAEFGAEITGRRVYELMEAYWPTADEHPEASEATREYAAIYRAQHRIVYSRTLEFVSPGAELHREVDAAEIRARVAASDRDFGLGGAHLAGEFLRQGLVDELRIYVHPVVIGRGTPLLPADVPLDLRLIESRTFGNGVVLLRYEIG
jgi:dihydrofolate reductase